MTELADLEIGLHRRDVGGYTAELRFSSPESAADVRVAGTGMSVDVYRLRDLSLDPSAYGQALSESLFSETALRTAFAQARAVTQSQEKPLRVRLFIGPSAPELHGLRWETLLDPEGGASLLTGEHLLFSRYLGSLDWQPVKLRPKAALKALALIANPSDLADYGMAPVDVEGELARARAGLGEIPLTQLGADGGATLNSLNTHLRDGCDILYVVAHGLLKDGEPWLWLEAEDGSTHRVAGAELVTRVRELQQRPRLVVLVSCQSAGNSPGKRPADEGMLAALGPRLVEAGIPAVLAMQGCVSIETMEQFVPTFFSELQRDGQIDRAMAVARGSVRERPDFWMPVLFLRLKSGRIWYTPGFADERGGAEKFPALLNHVRRGRCTPILGTGTLEPLIGSPREIAQRWAEIHHFPMQPSARDDLPQVAQYLRVFYNDDDFPRDQLREDLKRQLRERHPGALPPDMLEAPVEAQMKALVQPRWNADEPEAHHVLAELGCPLYVTTNPDNLLEEALRAHGVEPESEICPWNEYVELRSSVFEREPDYHPTPERPLVFHLFGLFGEPDSLVLTEDDYFDYLIGVASNRELIPGEVRRALADTALLFLGFHLDDWNFRVLFRSLMSQGGGGRRKRYAHLAAQIDPEERRLLDPERARRFLESYFQDADISIYWGSVQDFVEELRRHLRESDTR